jgi:hypothetical protein
MTYIYPSDLFRLRRDVRDYGREAKAPSEIVRSAEFVAVHEMCSGATQSGALTSARHYLWNSACRGSSPKGAA